MVYHYGSLKPILILVPRSEVLLQQIPKNVEVNSKLGDRNKPEEFWDAWFKKAETALRRLLEDMWIFKVILLRSQKDRELMRKLLSF